MKRKQVSNAGPLVYAAISCLIEVMPPATKGKPSKAAVSQAENDNKISGRFGRRVSNAQESKRFIGKIPESGRPRTSAYGGSTRGSESDISRPKTTPKEWRVQSPQREVTQSDRPSSGVSVASLHGLRAEQRTTWMHWWDSLFSSRNSICTISELKLQTRNHVRVCSAW